MANNDYTIGANNRIYFTDDDGNVDFGVDIIEFTANPDDELKKVGLMDGQTRSRNFKSGWNGSFGVLRNDAKLDEYIRADDVRYYSGLHPKNIQITQKIREQDGSVTTFKFVNVKIKLDDAGVYQHNEAVVQRVSFQAERRL